MKISEEVTFELTSNDKLEKEEDIKNAKNMFKN